MDAAISTLGGIELTEIDSNFQLKSMHNTCVIGELLDWFAPTGGYLLQGCFSMGATLANHLNQL
jgi:predicted flavoprotein YhiN